jgi:hypothetical protein
MYDLVVDLEVDVHGDRSDPTPYNNQNILSGIGYLRIGLDTDPICVFPDNSDRHRHIPIYPQRCPVRYRSQCQVRYVLVT